MSEYTLTQTPMHVFRDTYTGTPVYVGDFPPPYVPERSEPNLVTPLAPRNIEYVPSWMRRYERTIMSGKVVEIRGPEWRINHSCDKVIASIDIPGVKESDMTVDIENGTIVVTAKRFDTCVKSTYTQVIGDQFDSTSAKATLQHGILTVIVKQLKEKVSHRVQINKE